MLFVANVLLFSIIVFEDKSDQATIVDKPINKVTWNIAMLIPLSSMTSLAIMSELSSGARDSMPNKYLLSDS